MCGRCRFCPKTITAPVGRLGAAAQNALEVARFGGLDDRREPVAVRGHRRAARLPAAPLLPGRASAQRARRSLLVPPLMLAAEIYDVVAHHERGHDPARARRSTPGWSTSARPSARRAGSSARSPITCWRSPTRSIASASAPGATCIWPATRRAACSATRRPRYRRNDGLESLITFGSPVDTRLGMPFGLPEQLAAELAELLADRVPRRGVPAWFSRYGFRLLDPVKSVRNRLEFLLQLHDREALLPRERQRRFLEGEGWVAWPGPALAEFLRQFVASQPDARGRLRDRGPAASRLADIELPDPVGGRDGRRDRAARRACARSRRPPRGPTSTSCA